MTVKLNAMVTDITDSTVKYQVKGDDTVYTDWNRSVRSGSAGVAASPLGKMVADQLGAEVDRSGRVLVNHD